MRSSSTRTEVATERAYAVRTATPKPIVVTIEGETLTFRHKGEKRRFRLDISQAMKEAILRDA
jgi:hypothetical protein